MSPSPWLQPSDDTRLLRLYPAPVYMLGRKTAFFVAEVSDPDPVTKWWVLGPSHAATIQACIEHQGEDTVHAVFWRPMKAARPVFAQPVRDADLAEGWGVDRGEIRRRLSKVAPPAPKTVGPMKSKSDLLSILSLA